MSFEEERRESPAGQQLTPWLSDNIDGQVPGFLTHLAGEAPSEGFLPEPVLSEVEEVEMTCLK